MPRKEEAEARAEETRKAEAWAQAAGSWMQVGFRMAVEQSSGLTEQSRKSVGETPGMGAGDRTGRKRKQATGEGAGDVVEMRRCSRRRRRQQRWSGSVDGVRERQVATTSTGPARTTTSAVQSTGAQTSSRRSGGRQRRARRQRWRKAQSTLVAAHPNVAVLRFAAAAARRGIVVRGAE